MKSRQISRRKFMQAAACGASATLASRSYLLDPVSMAYAAPRPIPPTDTVRMGIIGVGMQGGSLLRTAIKLPGVECVAACDLYDGRRNLAREIVGKEIPTTRQYKELLDNKDIDCIIAAVPDHWHRQIVLDCCSAGKDVYCEKPMSHTVAEGFEMIAAEKRYSRIVQIGSQRRSSVVFAKARELCERGTIGDLCLVESYIGRNDPCGAWQYAVPPDLSPETLDWDSWLGPAPKKPFNAMHYTRWRCWQDYGEGIPGDLYVHLLTGIHYIAGITAPPQKAYSMGGLYRWKDGRDVPDAMSTLYEYPQFNAMIRVTLNTETEQVTRFMGTLGILEIRDGGLTMIPQEGVDYAPCAPGWPQKMKGYFVASWHKEHDPKPATSATVESTRYYPPKDYSDDREHLWNFFESVRTRRPSVEDATFGNNTAIACHMANFSYFKKTIATWDDAAKIIRG